MLNKILLILVTLLCIFILGMVYILINRSNKVSKKEIVSTPIVKELEKEVRLINNLNIQALADENKLNQYFLQFRESQKQNNTTNDLALTKAKTIGILITSERINNRDVFFSIPPDPDKADITFSRINKAESIQLIVYVGSKFLENKSPSEVKKILELQSLEILYLLFHPELYGSSTLVEDMVSQIGKYQSEIGPLFE